MKSLLNIGNEVVNNEETLAAIAKALVDIIEAGAENHTDQTTIQAAMKALSDISSIKNITVTDSVFTSNPPTPSTDINEDENESN